MAEKQLNVKLSASGGAQVAAEMNKAAGACGLSRRARSAAS